MAKRLKGVQEIEGRSNFILDGLDIVGGADCLRLLNCCNAIIRNCRFRNPAGPADPHGHCIILDKCSGVLIENCTCSSVRASITEDLISLYDSEDCGVIRCVLSGPTAPSGTAICIDGKKPLRCKLIDNVIKVTGPTGITIAGGAGHVVSGNKISGPTDCGIRVCNYYGGIIKGVTLRDNALSRKIDHPIWIDKKSTQGIIII